MSLTILLGAGAVSPMSDRFFLNIGIDWNDTANWSVASGGAGGASVPGTSDVAIFDSNSNDCTLNANVDVLGIDIKAGYVDTITQATEIEITCGTSGFSMFGGNFNGSDEFITINGTFIISGSGTSFTSTDITLTANGTFTLTDSASFTHNSGKVKLSATSGTINITSSSQSFYDFTIDGVGGTFSLVDGLTVANTFDHTNGIFDCNDFDLSLHDLVFGSGLSNGDFKAGSGTITISGTVNQNSDDPIAYETSHFLLTGNGESWATGNGLDQDFYKFSIADGVDFSFTGITTNNSHTVFDEFTLGVGSKFTVSGNGTFKVQSGAAGDHFIVDPTSEIELLGACVFHICEFSDNTTFLWDPCILTGTDGTFRLSSNAGSGTRLIQLQANILVSGKLTIGENANYFGTREVDFNTFDLNVTGNFINASSRGFGLIIGGSTLSVGGNYSSGDVRGTTTYAMDIDAGLMDIAGDFTFNTNVIKTCRLQNSGALHVGGNWAAVNKTTDFFEGDGTGILKFDGTGSLSITTGDAAHDFSDILTKIELTGGGSIALIQNTSFNDLTVTTGTFDPDTYDLTVTSNLTVNGGTFTGDSGAITISGNFIQSSGVFTSTSGTLSVAGSAFTVSAGTFTNNSGNVKIAGNTTITMASDDFFDLTIDNGSTTTMGSYLTVANDFLMTSTNSWAGPNLILSVGRHFTWNDASVGNTFNWVTFNGTGDQTITVVAFADLPTGNWKIDKTSGTVSLGSDLDLNLSTRDFTVTDGIFDLAGFNFTLVGDFVVNDTLRLKGNETITTTTTTISVTTSTVIFYDDLVTATVTDLATAFYNITFGASKVHEFAHGVGNGISVAGCMDSDGGSGTEAILRSVADAGIEWELNLSGTSALGDGVDVKYSDASAGLLVTACESIDSGNNTNWCLFMGPGQGFGFFMIFNKKKR